MSVDLAVLRAADRVVKLAWHWLPYADECAAEMRAARDEAEMGLIRDQRLISAALAKLEAEVLDGAELCGRQGQET